MSLLKPEEESLLKYCVLRHNPSLESAIEKVKRGCINRIELDEIIDTISSELTRSGIDDDWEVNKRGIALEDLIYKLLAPYTKD